MFIKVATRVFQFRMTIREIIHSDPVKRLFVADEQANSFLKRKQRADYEINF